MVVILIYKSLVIVFGERWSNTMLLFSWNNQLFHIILCQPADESSADIVLYWSGVRVILTGAVRQVYLAWIQAVTAFECPVTTWIKFVCNFCNFFLGWIGKGFEIKLWLVNKIYWFIIIWRSVSLFAVMWRHTLLV